MTDCGVSFTSTNQTSNNPYGVPFFIKPGRMLAPGVGPPAVTLGTAYDEYIDTTTGIEYIKNFNTGTWDAIIDYSTLPVIIPDPLTLNQLNVTTIEPDIANSPNVQFTLPAVGDSVNIGITGNLTNNQMFGDGSIILDSLTASIVIADTLGHQTTYGNNAITSSNTPITINGDTGVSVLTNSGNITLDAFNNANITGEQAVNISSNNLDITLSSVNNVVCSASSQVRLKVGGSDKLDATTSSVNFLVQTLSNVDGSVGPQYSSFVDTGSGLGADIGCNLFVGGVNKLAVGSTAITATAPLLVPNGLVGAPSYTFANDVTSGLYLNAGGNPVMSGSGAAVMGWTSGTTHCMAHVIPTANNTYDLGTGAVGWRNIYSNNALNVISDERRKKNIEALVPGLDLVENLCPVSYQFKDSNDERFKMGFIAQSTETVTNEYDKDYDVVNYDEANDAYTMKYEALIAVLVKSIQELNQRLKDVESKSN